jgi:predicted membrane protein
MSDQGHVDSSMPFIRCYLAFMVAPLIIPLAIWIALKEDQNVSTVMTIATIAGYVGTIIFGFPAYMLMRYSRMTSFVFAPIAGAALGFLVCLMALALFTGAIDTASPDNLFIMQWSAGLGALEGLVLWLIARPDKNATRVSPNAAAAKDEVGG